MGGGHHSWTQKTILLAEYALNSWSHREQCVHRVSEPSFAVYGLSWGLLFSNPRYLGHGKISGQVTDCGHDHKEIQKALDPILRGVIFSFFFYVMPCLLHKALNSAASHSQLKDCISPSLCALQHTGARSAISRKTEKAVWPQENLMIAYGKITGRNNHTVTLP